MIIYFTNHISSTKMLLSSAVFSKLPWDHMTQKSKRSTDNYRFTYFTVFDTTHSSGPNRPLLRWYKNVFKNFIIVHLILIFINYMISQTTYFYLTFYSIQLLYMYLFWHIRKWLTEKVWWIQQSPCVKWIQGSTSPSFLTVARTAALV